MIKSHMSLDRFSSLIKEGDFLKCSYQYNSKWQSRLYKVLLDKYTGITLMGYDYLDWGVDSGNNKISTERLHELYGNDLIDLYTGDLRVSDGTLMPNIDSPYFLSIADKQFLVFKQSFSFDEKTKYNTLERSSKIEIVETKLVDGNREIINYKHRTNGK